LLLGAARCPAQGRRSSRFEGAAGCTSQRPTMQTDRSGRAQNGGWEWFSQRARPSARSLARASPCQLTLHACPCRNLVSRRPSGDRQARRGLQNTMARAAETQEQDEGRTRAGDIQVTSTRGRVDGLEARALAALVRARRQSAAQVTMSSQLPAAAYMTVHISLPEMHRRRARVASGQQLASETPCSRSNGGARATRHASTRPRRRCRAPGRQARTTPPSSHSICQPYIVLGYVSFTGV